MGMATSASVPHPRLSPRRGRPWLLPLALLLAAAVGTTVADRGVWTERELQHAAARARTVLTTAPGVCNDDESLRSALRFLAGLVALPIAAVQEMKEPGRGDATLRDIFGERDEDKEATHRRCLEEAAEETERRRRAAWLEVYERTWPEPVSGALSSTCARDAADPSLCVDRAHRALDHVLESSHVRVGSYRLLWAFCFLPWAFGSAWLSVLLLRWAFEPERWPRRRA
jgi:hypothetical protein